VIAADVAVVKTPGQGSRPARVGGRNAQGAGPRRQGPGSRLAPRTAVHGLHGSILSGGSIVVEGPPDPYLDVLPADVGTKATRRWHVRPCIGS